MSPPAYLQDCPERIQLADDELLRDDVFHKEIFAGAHRRTGRRAERDGLAGILIRGVKYRSKRQGLEYLARQLRARSTPPRRRASSRGA